MTKLLRRFMLCRQGVTATEYALIASLIAVVIVTAVGTAGTQLSSSFTRIAGAFRNGAGLPQGVFAAGRKSPRTPPSIAFASRHVTA
jgi:pilus assembly protein Flp/PilA